MIQDKLGMILDNASTSDTPSKVNLGVGDNCLEFAVTGDGVTGNTIILSFTHSDTESGNFTAVLNVPVTAAQLNEGLSLSLPTTTKAFVSASVTGWTAGTLSIGLVLDGSQTNV